MIEKAVFKIKPIQHTIQLNFGSSDVKRTVIKQHSNETHLLVIKLYDTDNEILIDPNWKIDISAVKSDNTHILNSENISIAANAIHVLMTQQMLAAPGTEKCELVIREGEEILYSDTFLIYVEPNVQDGSYVQSSNEYNSIADVMKHVQNMKIDIDSEFEKLKNTRLEAITGEESYQVKITDKEGNSITSPNLLNKITIGTVETGEPDEHASAAITGEFGSQKLNLTLPKGIQGDKGETGATPQLSIGTVTTGEPGTNANATITGTADNPVINFEIPRGDTGLFINGGIVDGTITATNFIAKTNASGYSGTHQFKALNEYYPNASVECFVDQEGANIRLKTIGENRYYEIDTLNDALRLYCQDGSTVRSLASVNTSTWTFNINGNSTTATALTTSAGSAVQPVYFSDGKPAACTYTIGKSVPSDAVFTDTVYTHPSSGVTANTYGTNNTTALTPAFGSTFHVPAFAVNASGHITSASSHTVKIPNTQATASTLGLVKLYTDTGESTDGTMTQKAITQEMGNMLEYIDGYAAVSVLTCNSITLAANYDGQSSTAIPAKNGYTPLIASPRTAGTNDVVWEHCYISDSNIIARLKNTTSSSKTFSPTVYVLYVRS